MKWQVGMGANSVPTKTLLGEIARGPTPEEEKDDTSYLLSIAQ